MFDLEDYCRDYLPLFVPRWENLDRGSTWHSTQEKSRGGQLEHDYEAFMRHLSKDDWRDIVDEGFFAGDG